jgi:hypothetical protein
VGRRDDRARLEIDELDRLLFLVGDEGAAPAVDVGERDRASSGLPDGLHDCIVWRRRLRELAGRSRQRRRRTRRLRAAPTGERAGGEEGEREGKSSKRAHDPTSRRTLDP